MLPLDSGFDLVFLIGIFTSSFIGSAHCIGMCGGLVLAATHTDFASESGYPSGSVRSKFLLNQIFYHGSRLLSYLILGGLAGLIGKTLLNRDSVVDHNHGASMNYEVPEYLSMIATVSVAIIFIYTGVKIFKGGKLSSPMDKYFHKISLRIFPKANRLTGYARPIVTGLATGLLPCAWLYSFVLMSLATKSSVQGSLVLAVFWLGTIPALSFGTLFIQRMLLQFNLQIYRIIGLVLVLIGLLTLFGRIHQIH